MTPFRTHLKVSFPKLFWRGAKFFGCLFAIFWIATIVLLVMASPLPIWFILTLPALGLECVIATAAAGALYAFVGVTFGWLVERADKGAASN